MNYINEATKKDLLNKSLRSQKGRERYNRRKRSKIGNKVKQYNNIDMNKLFKQGILDINIDVQGETDNYVVRISFGGILDEIHRLMKGKTAIDLSIIIKALRNCMNREDTYVHCSCSDFCLEESTKIKLLDGTTPTVKELLDRYSSGEDLYLYSVNDDGDFVPGHITDVWISGMSNELIEVTLDNGRKIKTTPNHLFMLRDGSYVRADELTVGQSLMPLYFKETNGYETVKSNSLQTTSYFSVYKIVAQQLLQEQIEEAKSRTGEDIIHIHHKDFNKSNNSPSNLIPMGANEHWKYHYTHVKESGVLDKWLAAGREYWKSPEARAKQAEVLRANMSKYYATHTREEIVAKRRASGIYGQQWKDKVGAGNRAAWKNYTHEEYLERCRIHAEAQNNPITKQKQSDIRKKYFIEHPEFKETVLNNFSKSWTTYCKQPKPPEVRQKMSDARKYESAEHLQQRIDAFRATLAAKTKEERDLSSIKNRDSRIRNRLLQMISDGVDITFENYDLYRKNGDPKLTKYFSSVEEVLAYFNIDAEINHKVKCINTIKLDTPVPVYDISVEGTHNFYVDAGVILHNCYRFSYWSTLHNYNSGEPQYSNGKKIRNPNDTLGSACKHVLLVLSNVTWLIKVASTINNYIKYVQSHYKKQYANIIYPAIYDKKYQDPVQTSIFDKDDLDKSEIDAANDEGRVRGQFKPGNKQGVRFAPSTKINSRQQQFDLDSDKE